MAAIYVHLSGRDVDNALLTKVYGLKTDQEEKKDKSTPILCRRCGTGNPYTSKFCNLCGIPLSEDAAMGLIRREQERNPSDSIMDRLIKDTEFRDLMQSKISELTPRPRQSR